MREKNRHPDGGRILRSEAEQRIIDEADALAARLAEMREAGRQAAERELAGLKRTRTHVMFELHWAKNPDQFDAIAKDALAAGLISKSDFDDLMSHGVDVERSPKTRSPKQRPIVYNENGGSFGPRRR